MRLLLTSAGIKNQSIHDALEDLLGKPIAESSALCIPTGMYGGVYGPRMPRTIHRTDVRAWLEVTGSAGADRAAKHR